MNADKLKELIYKLETKGDVSKKEADGIYSLFNKTTLKRAINPMSVYTEEDLFSRALKWMQAVLEKLERKETGNFIMSLPITIRHYYGNYESIALEKQHVKIISAMSPLDRARYIIASKDVYDAAKNKTNITLVSDVALTSGREWVAQKAERAGIIYRNKYRNILSRFGEIPVLRDEVNPPIFQHVWKYGNNSFKGWERSTKKAFYTSAILKVVKEKNIPFANIIYISRSPSFPAIPKENETIMVPEREARKISRIAESDVVIERLQKTGLINISGENVGSYIRSTDMVAAVEAGGRIFLEEYKRICTEQKLLKETREEADEWLELDR